MRRPTTAPVWSSVHVAGLRVGDEGVVMTSSMTGAGTVVAPDTDLDSGRSGATLTPAQAERAARAFKALSDPVRLRMVSLIAAAPAGEVCVCDVTSEFPLSQPTISYHLKALREAGLVTATKRATWSYYRLAPGALTTVVRLLESMDTARL